MLKAWLHFLFGIGLLVFAGLELVVGQLLFWAKHDEGAGPSTVLGDLFFISIWWGIALACLIGVFFQFRKSLRNLRDTAK